MAHTVKTMMPLLNARRCPRLVSWRGRNESVATKLARNGKPLKGVLAPVHRISAVAKETNRNPMCPRGLVPSAAVETAIDGWYGDYLKGAFADYADRLDELKALVGFAGRFEEMQDFLAQIMLLNSETSDRQVDPDADAVKLTTVHQAKGLEYDVVFLIGLADGQFPGRRAIEAGDVEEERRLFYVAVTRARNELYLSYPKIASRAGPGGMMLTPSRFILELPSELYEPLKIKRSYAW